MVDCLFRRDPFLSLLSLSIAKRGIFQHTAALKVAWVMSPGSRKRGRLRYFSIYVRKYIFMYCTYIHMYCTYVGMYVLYCTALYYIPCFYLLQDLCSDLLLSIYLFFYLFIIFKLTNKTNQKKKKERKKGNFISEIPFWTSRSASLGKLPPEFLLLSSVKAPLPSKWWRWRTEGQWARILGLTRTN